MIRLPQALRPLIEALVSRPDGSAVTEYNEPGSAVWQRTGFMHRQRYAFAARQVAGKSVLNVACGPGYAEAILMTGHPARIVAVDYDQDLIARLRARPPIGRPGVEYQQADAEALPESLGKFDVIVSFENIEHLRSPERFLAGVRRLANPNAKLILSTPNRLKYSGHPERPYNNPFHVREYDFRELSALLAPHLSRIETFAQIERNYTGLANEIDAALRALNSLWMVRLERAARRLLGRPAQDFSFLPFETDLLPVPAEACADVDTFVIVGTIEPEPGAGLG
jgi:SAM-dependent methyltransferase